MRFLMWLLVGLAGCWPRIPGPYSDYDDGSDTDTDTDTDGALSCPGDDAYEDNDGPTTATELSVPVSLDAVACTDDFDYYAFDTSAGCVITVLVTFTHDAGDIDAQLFERDVPVVSGQSVDDDELLSWFSEGSFEYTVAVYGYEGAENTYTLDVDVECGS